MLSRSLHLENEGSQNCNRLHGGSQKTDDFSNCLQISVTLFTTAISYFSPITGQLKLSNSHCCETINPDIWQVEFES